MKKFIPIIRTVLIVLLAALVLVAAGFAVYDVVKSRLAAPKSDVGEERVFEAVESAVKAHIGSYTSIEFCPKNEQTVTNDGNTWTVSGYAETTNAKGDVTRTNYTVKLTYVGNDQFLLDTCNLF